MPEATMKFAVTCPECAMESMMGLSIATIANALLTGRSIRLYARCHDQFWTATFIERGQLRQSLATLNIEAAHVNDPQPRTHRDGQIPSTC